MSDKTCLDLMVGLGNKYPKQLLNSAVHKVLFSDSNSWIFKQDLQKRGVAVWSISLANGTEWHGQHIVLDRLWKKDTSIGDCISVSGTHPVHGYRSQHLQLDGRIGEQYFVDGTVDRRTLDIRATLLNTALVFLSVVFSECFGSCIRRPV
jgi:hypothetical protein